jgi:hypothetical protein
MAGRQNTYVITTDGALWQHTGSNHSTGWTELTARGVTGVSVGVDSKGNDVQFVQFNDALSEHTGNNPTTGWSLLSATDVGSITASQIQANTVFTTYNGDMWEYSGGNWTQLETSGVLSISAGVGSNGKAAVFENYGGELWEYSSAGWTDIASHVQVIRASQFKANTVFYSTGTDLWEHAGSAGNWQITSSGVTSFSAGLGSSGNAVVFAVVNGDLREFSGTKGNMISTDLQNGGVTWFAASQHAADTVFIAWSGELWQVSGRKPNTKWSLVL